MNKINYKIIQFLTLIFISSSIISCSDKNTLEGWEPVKFGMSLSEAKEAMNSLNLKLVEERDDYLRYEYLKVAGIDEYSVNIFFKQNKLYQTNLAKDYGFDGLEVDVDTISSALSDKYGKPSLKLDKGYKWDFENGKIEVGENYKRVIVSYKLKENSNL